MATGRTCSEGSFWPVPDSPAKRLPERGEAGTFWEDRGDRRHTGVDIYAPEGSPVVAVKGGTVLETGVFTSPEQIPYWNVTWYVFVGQEDGLFARYAELRCALVHRGERVAAGQVIGEVGSVLDPQKIGDQAPEYIQRLKRNGHPSMLHFELYRGSDLSFPVKYLGGNLFGTERPEQLLDPSDYLRPLLRS